MNELSPTAIKVKIDNPTRIPIVRGDISSSPKETAKNIFVKSTKCMGAKDGVIDVASCYGLQNEHEKETDK